MKPTFTLKLPKYSLLEKSTNNTCICDRCGRDIKNAYTIKNNETFEVGTFGSGCAKFMMEGKSITEMCQENEAYKRAKTSFEDEMLRFNNGSLNITEFKEANPDMLQFISEGFETNSFLKDMKTKIETAGTLTNNQFCAVERMMLPWAELDSKIENIKVTPLTMTIKQGYYDGYEHTITAINDKNEKIRIFFSSLNEQKERILIDSGVLGIDRNGYITKNSTPENRKTILLSGSFDGYKVKRAKLSEV